MLTQKKLTIKKKIIYFSVIVAMLGGTFFSIFKNYQLAHRGSVGEELDPAMMIGITELQAIPVVNSGSVVAPQKTRVAGFDVSIFDDPKFLKMQDFSVVQPYKVVPGKTNPFEPK